MVFLSCLHGSEPGMQGLNVTPKFLSCLHGSELAIVEDELHLVFLSCLHGSEQVTLVGAKSTDFSKLPTWQ